MNKQLFIHTYFRTTPAELWQLLNTRDTAPARASQDMQTARKQNDASRKAAREWVWAEYAQCSFVSEDPAPSHRITAPEVEAAIDTSVFLLAAGEGNRVTV
jgi:hypothetical protein